MLDHPSGSHIGFFVFEARDGFTGGKLGQPTVKVKLLSVDTHWTTHNSPAAPHSPIVFQEIVVVSPSSGK